MNTFGQIFKLTSFGESHGKAIGGIIDGCPAGLEIDLDFIQSELDRRKPGQSKITTQRDESDQVEFLSGIFEGKTQGTPIGFIVRNKDQHSGDYNDLKDVFRPSHADYTYIQKYGTRDHRGGGRSSARETIARVVGGAIAKLLLKKAGVQINAFVSRVGEINLDKPYQELDLSKTESTIVRCPDQETAEKMIARIEEAGHNHDTVGGVITGVAAGVPAGWGEPVFNKLHADLGFAMLGINAVKGFEYGSGFEGTKLSGSLHNDVFIKTEDGIRTKTNHSGGIQGGISNGEDIYFRVAFKPIATLLKEQQTVDKSSNEVTINPKGRHDPCVLPRAVPIVEAMAAMVLADHFLLNRINKI
ncbi:MAG: chorismate synthase [Bacteroidetes bacterium GWF2_42_66]|nr:MAG: chorismate synthase [Bacteroidetes bacterium GWA2_42_15]OFX98861.1 MAG: chorismate synthase [Bacteroidetes bacterium GWE2_42_39]OFY45575.1 MAG: chorismate synthase [Bacteroidetes bacterium GWF2_42_66]HBL77447.1 chorismate synthase [Prolixibacteraceae bacterium]HCR91216.1 chorismate synthase [Prolixibacteraceae bacterium]